MLSITLSSISLKKSEGMFDFVIFISKFLLDKFYCSNTVFTSKFDRIPTNFLNSFPSDPI